MCNAKQIGIPWIRLVIREYPCVYVVKIAKADAEFGREERTKTRRETDVYNVRLFREGKIVGEYLNGKRHWEMRSAVAGMSERKNGEGSLW